MNTLSADLKKATNDINQLKRANDSKSDKLRKIEETHKNLWETLNKNAIDITEPVNEQISQFKNESLNQENVQKVVLELMEKQSPQQPSTNKTNSTKDQSTSDKAHPKQIKLDVIILMDSIREFVNKKKLFPKQNTYMIPCPTIDKGHEILTDTTFTGQHSIVIHTRVNDIESSSPEKVSRNLLQLLSACKQKYPTTKITASSITPRKDKFNEYVKQANQIIGSEINNNQLDDIILVDNSNLDHPDLLYDVKHLNKNSGIKILATNIKNVIRPKFGKVNNNMSEQPNQPKSYSATVKTARNTHPENRHSSAEMSEVLFQLKQMNSFLIKNHSPQKPHHLPPTGHWFPDTTLHSQPPFYQPPSGWYPLTGNNWVLNNR